MVTPSPAPFTTAGLCCTISRAYPGVLTLVMLLETVVSAVWLACRPDAAAAINALSAIAYLRPARRAAALGKSCRAGGPVGPAGPANTLISIYFIFGADIMAKRARQERRQPLGRTVGNAVLAYRGPAKTAAHGAGEVPRFTINPHVFNVLGRWRGGC